MNQKHYLQASQTPESESILIKKPPLGSSSMHKDSIYSIFESNSNRTKSYNDMSSS